MSEVQSTTNNHNKRQKHKLKGSDRDEAVSQFLSQISKDSLTFLNKNSIFADYKGGKPILHCQACRCSFTTVSQARQHASYPSHIDVINANTTIHLLEHLPPISAAHREALDQVLNEASQNVFISSQEAERRSAFAQSVFTVLKARIPALEMRIVGSVLTGMSFQDSDVNLNAYIDPVDGIAVDCRLSYNKSAVVSDSKEVAKPVASSGSDHRTSAAFIDPYKPGFGPHLLEILEVLRPLVPQKNGDTLKVSENDALPPFPPMHQLLQCNLENFNLTFKDPEEVTYRITVGNPLGFHLGTLINAYLSIDERARQLATLFRKLAKMAFLDLPDIHTFQPPALTIMVIFYLQHTSPPILPNLHEIAHRSDVPDDTVEVVTSSEGNFSFLKDLSILQRFFPAYKSKNVNDPQVNRKTIAELWLGFLRFYRFQFQARICILSIRCSDPIPKSSYKNASSYLWVEDPFSPTTCMTRNLMPSTVDYILAQFAAVYAYFGVPRLAKNGRHLFTKVQLHTQNSGSTDGDKDPQEICISKLKNTAASVLNVAIKSTMDTENDFNEHITKVTSMFSIEFSSLAGQSTKSESFQNPALSTSSISNNTLNAMEIMPIVLKLAFDEIIAQEYVEIVVQTSIKKIRMVSHNTAGTLIEFGLTDATGFIRCFCISLWHSIFKTFINKGAFKASENRLAKLAQSAFRSIINVFRSVRNARLFNSESGKNTAPTAVTSAPEEQHEEKVLDPPPSDNDEVEEKNGAIDEADTSADKTFTSDEFLENDEPVGDGASDEVDEENREREQLTTEELLFLEDGNDEEPVTTNGEVMDADSITARETDSTIDKQKSNKQSSEKGTDKWHLYIKRGDNGLAVVDSNKPDYYRSDDVNALLMEDLSFPFLSRGVVTSGKMTIRSSVLGLALPNHPSTMLAHFRPPAEICKQCGTTGHCSENCTSSPHETVSLNPWRKLKDVYPVCQDQTHLAELSTCLMELSAYNTSEEQNQYRKNFVQRLNRLFATKYPSVVLELFGSSANGFEMKESDMDICVFFPPGSHEAEVLSNTNTRIQFINTFKKMLNAGARELGITRLHPVLQAKVPIIKFMVQNRFEADLSFSNYLAISNTRMLRVYNQINPNLRVLDIALKILIKTCKIAKADAGGISSYAYAIMLIYYMQQKGYLPVLQELYDAPDRPIVKAGDWNIWYQNDMNLINKLWTSRKTATVGEAWLGFFRFYLFEFDREHYVITINQKKPLERLGKLWNSLLAIEDPFNLRHNLTAAVQRKILTHILNTFFTVLKHHSAARGDVDLNIWKFSLFSPQTLGCLKGKPRERQNSRKTPLKNNAGESGRSVGVLGDHPANALLRLPFQGKQQQQPAFHGFLVQPHYNPQGLQPVRGMNHNVHPQINGGYYQQPQHRYPNAVFTPRVTYWGGFLQKQHQQPRPQHQDLHFNHRGQQGLVSYRVCQPALPMNAVPQPPALLNHHQLPFTNSFTHASHQQQQDSKLKNKRGRGKRHGGGFSFSENV